MKKKCPIISFNRDEPLGHYAKWNKPVKKGHTLHTVWFHSYGWSKVAKNHRNRKEKGGCQSLGGGGSGDLCFMGSWFYNIEKLQEICCITM